MCFFIKSLLCNKSPCLNKSVFIVFFLFFFSIFLNAKTDNAMRIHQNFNGRLSDYFSFHFYSFEQFTEDISRYDYYETGVGVKCKFPRRFALSVYYRQGYYRDDDNGWSLEKAPQVNIEKGLQMKMILIFDQVRYEYRYKPEWDDFRIKNFLKISLPQIPFRPFLGWELYYEHYYEEVNLHRFHAGIFENIYNGLVFGIYYRYDLSKSDDKWEHIRDMYGVRVALSL